MASVAVVRGGRSLERDISLRSGHHIAAALRLLGHDATEVDVDADLTKKLVDAELVFIALHGRDGEDGTIQLACEALGVAYTGSSPLACRFSFDKGLAKGLFHQHGLPTPPGYVLSREAVQHMGAGVALRRAAERLGYPLVVKPAAQGSGLGLSVVEDGGELTHAALGAFDHGDRILVERFVDGTDVSIVLCGAELRALPPVAVKIRGKVFDFETRVSPGAYELVPLDGPSDEMSSLARRAADAVGLRDFGRIDLRIDDGGPTILDVKTCPGLTESSIVPFAVAADGKRFEDLVREISELALARSPLARR